MKKVLLPLIFTVLIAFSGCESQAPVNLLQFIDRYNGTENYAEISITDFYTGTDVDTISYYLFFDGVLLTIRTNNSKGYISDCSLTYSGTAPASYPGLLSTVMFSFTGSYSENSADYVYTSSENELGGCTIISAVRFTDHSDTKKPNPSDYSQLFQTSGQ